jgi:hypothetical protein
VALRTGTVAINQPLLLDLRERDPATSSGVKNNTIRTGDFRPMAGTGNTASASITVGSSSNLSARPFGAASIAVDGSTA